MIQKIKNKINSYQEGYLVYSFIYWSTKIMWIYCLMKSNWFGTAGFLIADILSYIEARKRA